MWNSNQIEALSLIIVEHLKPDWNEISKYTKEGEGDGGDALEVELHLPAAHSQSIFQEAEWKIGLASQMF